jgi:hypothetical protein
MNSAYAPNPQSRVPTRVFQGCVVTTDLPTLGTNPNSKQHGSTTKEAKDLGNLRCLGRTVRGALADSPRGAGSRSKNETRTTSAAPRNTDGQYPTRGRSECNLCHMDGLRPPGGRSANYLQWNSTSPTDRTTYTQEQETNWMNTRPHGLSARCGQSCSSPKTRSQPLLSIHGSPKWLELLRKDLGEMWSIPGGCYAPKLEPSNELNCRESNHNRALPKSKGSNRNPSIEGRIQRLRGHVKSQRCMRQLSMIPTNKSKPKHLRIEGTSHARKSNENSSKKTQATRRRSTQPWKAPYTRRSDSLQTSE